MYLILFFSIINNGWVELCSHRYSFPFSARPWHFNFHPNVLAPSYSSIIANVCPAINSRRLVSMASRAPSLPECHLLHCLSLHLNLHLDYAVGIWERRAGAGVLEYCILSCLIDGRIGTNILSSYGPARAKVPRACKTRTGAVIKQMSFKVPGLPAGVIKSKIPGQGGSP